MRIRMANPQIENGYVKISNELYDQLLKYRMPGQVRQVIDTVIRETYGWNKKYAKIRNKDFVLKTGLSKSDVCDSLKTAQEHNLINKNQAGEWGFEKDYEKWKKFPKKGTKEKFPITRTKVPVDGNKTFPLTATSTDVLKTVKTYKDIIGISTSEGKRQCPTPQSSAAPPSPEGVQEYYGVKFKEKFGKEYIANPGKDKKILGDLLKSIEKTELETLIDRFFVSKDKFITGSDYTIRMFNQVINKLRITQGGTPEWMLAK
jgi:phage replication O-like protein O